MNDRLREAVDRFVIGDYRGQFWILQLAGWSGLSVVSYFSLNVWYDQPDLAYLAHNVAQSVLGVVISSPLRLVYRAVWRSPTILRLSVIALAVLLFSTLWAALRLALFEAMTEESNLWSDFGGWLFPSIFIFLCWTALYHVFKYYRVAEAEHSALLRMSSERNREAAKAARAESTAREAQLTMLRYQLNPHFLFNTLNAIQSLVTSRQTDRATQMIASLSDFLRYSLYKDSKKLVTVADEVAAVRLYLQIEQARFGDRLVVDITVADDAREELMPSMLLQPLIENSIKHAIARAESGGHIKIEAYTESGHLYLKVSDSGSDDVNLPRIGAEGVGLKNIRARLASTYGTDHDFQLQAIAGGGLTAEIRIPLLYHAAIA